MVITILFVHHIFCQIFTTPHFQACQTASLLGLHSNFGIEDFLVPLILQDRLAFVDEFLEGSPAHQVQLVSFLDSCLGKSRNLKTCLEEVIARLGVPEVRSEKLYYKPWRKLVTRLVKMFDLPEEVSPFLNVKRNEGALQFLLHKRFVENSFGRSKIVSIYCDANELL